MPKHLIALLFLIASPAWAEIEPVPERVQGEGPFSRLILRGVNVVTGEGAPAYGPMDVVIEGVSPGDEPFLSARRIVVKKPVARRPSAGGSVPSPAATSSLVAPAG